MVIGETLLLYGRFFLKLWVSSLKNSVRSYQYCLRNSYLWYNLMDSFVKGVFLKYILNNHSGIIEHRVLYKYLVITIYCESKFPITAELISVK
jgi:hypothetical protein